MTVELPDTDQNRGEGVILDMTTHDEKTLAKVYAGLKAAGIYNQDAIDAVNQIQNHGILFREGVKKADFFNTITTERKQQRGHGYDEAHDDREGLNHLVHLAQAYFARGKLIEGNAMLLAIEDYIRRNPRPRVNPMQEDVHTMMGLYEQNRPSYPQLADVDDAQLRINLMIEELIGAKNPEDPIYGPGALIVQSKSDELVASIVKGDLVGIADGIGDVLTVVFGTAVAYGINAQEVFDEVHRSNMTKAVWSEDEQRYILVKNEYGKVIKPESYSPADVEAVILRQISVGLENEETVVAELVEDDE